MALDSVAGWGRFPKLCVDVYRWGDRFFNTYDSTYVQGTGYKFNVKARTETWFDSYYFRLDDGYRMNFASETNTSAGFYVTYLALSLGYDFNVDRMFGGTGSKRNKFNFKFNCALLSAELYWMNNDIGTELRQYGKPPEMSSTRVPFHGLYTDIFGVDAYYSFNHKRYSRAAAFNFSKVQKRSQGSWIAGLSYWRQNFQFDFNTLPPDIREELPEDWAAFGYSYHLRAQNYAFRLGYGYNWVFAPHWLMGVSESPSVGLRHGRTNGTDPKNTLSLYNRLQLSVVWNNGAWFAGVIAGAENGLIVDKTRSIMNGVYTVEASGGYRFNLW